MLLIGYFYDTIALFTAAGILAALLNYPVRWLSRYFPRSAVIPLVFITAVLILLVLIAALGLEVLNQGQELVEQITEALTTQTIIPWEEVWGNFKMERAFDTLQSSLLTGIGVAQGIFSNVFRLIFLAVISLYMLIDGDKLWTMMLRLVPAHARDRFADAFQRSFLGFLRGQILLMMFLALASYFVFVLLGINYALFLALIVGIVDAIPGIGATLGVLLISILVLASQGWQVALKVVVASIILQQIQDNLIHPKVMGRVLEVNPVLLFLSLFIGERIAGILGVFLAVPVAGMIAAWVKAESLETEKLPESE